MLTRTYRWIAAFVLLSTLALLSLPAHAQEGTVPGTLPETGAAAPTAWPALLVFGLIVAVAAVQMMRRRQAQAS